VKIRTLTVAVLLVLSAFAAAGKHAPAVLTDDGVVYTVAPLPAPLLQLVRREGARRQTIVVPTLDDATITEAQLAFDSATSTLFVVWHAGDSVYVGRRASDGTWAEPIMVDLGAKRAGLEIVLTRVTSTTLLHVAWWKIEDEPVAEYALLAFDDRQHVSSFVSDLNSLVGSNSAADYSADNEPMSAVLHPPLAMARAGAAGVDIVFGSGSSTRLTRIILDPKIRVDARLWKPSRKGGGQTPRSGLMSANGDPVEAILSQGRIILYTPDTNFRFVILEKGRWSPERMIQLDENLTREQLVEELRKTVERLEIDETPDESVNE
jgi:hypothetical protein